MSNARRLTLPDSFAVPEILESDWCRLRPLAAEHSQRDFAAVMETQTRLRASSPNGWPREGFTLAENTRDLTDHAQEFARRESFAYTVLSLDEVEVLGCVYLNPPSGSADVDVHLWVREREYANGFAIRLHALVDEWLRSRWPFERISYLRPDYCFAPGRCLCGTVRFYAGPVHGPLELCHCPRCRRASGSAFAAMVGVGEVRFAAGEALVRTHTLELLRSPPAYRRSFCGTCGSPVPDPSVEGSQEVPAGCLALLPVSADRHIYTEHAASWLEGADALPRLTSGEIRELRKASTPPTGAP